MQERSVEKDSWQKAVLPLTVTEKETVVSPVRGAGGVSGMGEPAREEPAREELGGANKEME